MPTASRRRSTAAAYEATPSAGVDAGSPRARAMSWNLSGAR